MHPPAIRDWRRPTYVPREPQIPKETCPRCWGPARPIRFTSSDYAELLGLYLGDGCISEHPRTQRLRIVLDTKYPQIISDARALLERCFPHNDVDAVQSMGCVHVSVYSAHLGCVLPQHGPGKKHDRVIRLEPWQSAVVDAAPWPFLKGCIRSDGCAFINRTGPYEYLSYEFCNKSKEIVELFTGACQRVGVRFRVTGPGWRGVWRTRINRRESVALMVEHVGLKS